MPLFTYRGIDGPRGRELRKTVRERHLEHLRGHSEAGRVRFGGPLIDSAGQPCGSLVILEAADLSAAREIAESDPYLVEGVFERVEINETKAVFPEA
jgi:uncharacterized protein YciI